MSRTAKGYPSLIRGYAHDRRGHSACQQIWTHMQHTRALTRALTRTHTHTHTRQLVYVQVSVVRRTWSPSTQCLPTVDRLMTHPSPKVALSPTRESLLACTAQWTVDCRSLQSSNTDWSLQHLAFSLSLSPSHCPPPSLPPSLPLHTLT